MRAQATTSVFLDATYKHEILGGIIRCHHLGKGLVDDASGLYRHEEDNSHLHFCRLQPEGNETRDTRGEQNRKNDPVFGGGFRKPWGTATKWLEKEEARHLLPFRGGVHAAFKG